MEEEIFDYSKGLNAPYWIQEVAIDTKKGKKVLWTFSVPVQISYFVLFFLTLILMLTVMAPIMSFLYKVTYSGSVLLYFFIPKKVARFYSEFEPQGKKMHVFLWDYLRYFISFVLNKKPIYQGERMEDFKDEEIVFEKTQL